MLSIPKFLADIGLELNRRYYGKRLKELYFQKGRQSPSWFDHRIDIHYNWPNNLFWVERGLYALKQMKPQCTVLDLFCGDGYYSANFYSQLAARIDAVDKDPEAIAHARRYSANPKVTYHLGDLRRLDLPRTQYDVITWFEAIEHLSEEDYRSLLQRIKTLIGKTGALVGSTPLVHPDHHGEANWEHVHEFSTEDELRATLEKDFAEVRIERSGYPEGQSGWRDTAYFTVRSPK